MWTPMKVKNCFQLTPSRVTVRFINHCKVTPFFMCFLHQNSTPMNGLLHRHRSFCFHVQLWTKKVLNLNLLHVESFYRSSLNRLEESCHSVGDRMHVAMHGHFVFYRTIVFLTQVKFKKFESNAFITSTSVPSTRAELFSNRSFVVCLIFHILTFSLDSTTMYSFTLQIFFTHILCSPCVTLSISEGFSLPTQFLEANLWQSWCHKLFQIKDSDWQTFETISAIRAS